MVDFKLLILLYAPVLLLFLLYPLKDRYEFQIIKGVENHYSLLPAIIVIVVQLSHHMFYSYWLKYKIFGYSYHQTAWELVILLWNLLTIFLIFIMLKLYRTSLIDIIVVKKKYIFNVLKVGAVLTTVILLLPQFFGVDITDDVMRENRTTIRSMPLKEITIFSFNTLFFLPVVEEIVYRGLLYGPLYRKIGRNGALFFASLIFLHAHFGVLLTSFFGSAVIFLKGFFLTWIYDRERTLIYPIGAHIIMNIWFMYYQFAN